MHKYNIIWENTKIFKNNLLTMKSRVINKCKYVYEVLIEKIMEFTEHLKYKFRRTDEYKSNLVEIYNIKEKHLNKEHVQAFLRERKKATAPNRYKIEVRIDKTPGNDDIIGEVTLMRKNKLIEKATLITKKNTPDPDKLIYGQY